MAGDGLDQRVDRREFLRRAGMTAVLLAASDGLLPRKELAEAAVAASTLQDLPESRSVADLLFEPGRRMAVGEDAVGDPGVWRFSEADGTWERIAGAAAFPEGTRLTTITALEEVIVAAGFITQTIREDVVANEQGVLSVQPVESIEPAVFSSADGRVWTVAARRLPSVQWGAFSRMVTASDGRLFGVGSSFTEPGPSETGALFGVVTEDLKGWEAVELGGVADPIHGGVTLLASHGERLLLGAAGIGLASLYVADDPAGPWRPLPAPSMPDPVSFIGIAPHPRGFLLAGVERFGDGVFLWEGGEGGWLRRTPDPELQGAWTLTDLDGATGIADVAGSLGSTLSDMTGFVAQLEG